MAVDVVYVVREGVNEELRYSLRSLRNLEHGKVFVVGHAEPWLKNVIHVPAPDQRDKFVSQRMKLFAAVAQTDLSKAFILMNDDMYVTKPLKELRTQHRGRWLDLGVTPFTSWWMTLRSTALWMGEQGFPNPTTYECHTPLVFSKRRLLDVLLRYPDELPFAVGMTYEMTGAGGPGHPGPDVKVRDPAQWQERVPGPYLSSMDASFDSTPISVYLKELFPEPSEYEES